MNEQNLSLDVKPVCLIMWQMKICLILIIYKLKYDQYWYYKHKTITYQGVCCIYNYLHYLFVLMETFLELGL